MRQLSNDEIQDVSGGIALAFVLSIISGSKGYSLGNTVINSALFYGVIGAIAGLPFAIVGAAITGPLYAIYGAAEGFVGYQIGSFLAD